jgi:molybdopterin synthase catalytic subunit
MQIHVLYFAAARERAGVSREQMELPEGSTVRRAMEMVAERHAGLRPLIPHLRAALNEEFAQLDDSIADGAELALIPPVAGGAGLLEISDRPIDPQRAIAAVSGDLYGGLVTFYGSVRSSTRERPVLRLEYEAYGPMANKMLERIAGEVAQKWPGTRVAIIHRVGVLKPGELAVAIAAAAPHRKEAFRACEYAIERIKADAPIWKKEFYQNGEMWVGLHP